MRLEVDEFCWYLQSFRICIYSIYIYVTIRISFCVQQFKTRAFHLDSFLGLNKLTSNLCWDVGVKHWQYHTPIHIYEPRPTNSKPSKHKGSAYLPIRACRWWDGDSIPQASLWHQKEYHSWKVLLPNAQFKLIAKHHPVELYSNAISVYWLLVFTSAGLNTWSLMIMNFF